MLPVRIESLTEDQEQINSIEVAAIEALERLGCDPSTTARNQIWAIDLCLRELTTPTGNSKNPLHGDDPEEVAWLLGALWGQILCQQLGWQWIRVQFSSPSAPQLVGLASPKHELVIYPFLFIFHCIDSAQPVTIGKSYDLLLQPHRIPQLSENALENVMEHVAPD